MQNTYADERKVSDGKLRLSFRRVSRDRHGEVLVRLQVVRVRVRVLRVIWPIVKNCAELVGGRRANIVCVERTA